MTITELERLLANLLRVGIVTEVNTQKRCCRVKTGELMTDWIRWGVQRAGVSQSWWAPSVGEQVIVAAINGELTTGFVLCSLYSEKHDAPTHSEQALHYAFSDGATIEYEPKTGHLKAIRVKTAEINALEKIDVTAPAIACHAGVKIELNTPEVACSSLLSCKSLSVSEGGKMSGNIQHSGGSLSSNGVVLGTHIHSGIQRGNSKTDGPV